MDFGQWIVSVREQKGISVRAFARATGIPFSTLQRIETAQHFMPSLRTTFQLCRALGVTVEQLLSELEGVKYVPGDDKMLKPQEMGSKMFITREDVLRFIENDGTAVNIATIILALVNQSQNIYRPDAVSKKTTEPIQSVVPTLPFFGGPIFDVRLRHPTGFDIDEIHNIYLSGGALSLVEIGRMIRQTRLEKVGKLTDLRQSHTTVFPFSSSSISTLSRLETGELENIDLEQIMSLSKVLYDDFSLVKMYWNAPAIDDRPTALPLLPGLWVSLDVNFYIIFGRWLGLLYGEDISWLRKLRAEV